MGLTLLSQYAAIPSSPMAQIYCANTLSRMVFPTLRNTQAWVPGFATIRQGTSKDTVDDFSEPRPPDKS